MPAVYPTIVGVTPAPGGGILVSKASAAFRVNIAMALSSTAFVPRFGVVSPQPGDRDLETTTGVTILSYMSAAIVENGDLLSIGINGEIPAEYNGSLIGVGATVITPELFGQGVGPQRAV